MSDAINSNPDFDSEAILQQSQSASDEETLQSQNEQLHSALEELLVAEEELRAQNDELISMRLSMESERRRYYDLFDFAPDGYLMTDLYGIIQEANRAAATLLDRFPESLLGKPLANFVLEEERWAFRSQLSRLREAADRQEWEIRVRPSERPTFPACLTVAPVLDREGRPTALRWLLRDITERKRAEAFREGTARLSGIIESAMDALIAINAIQIIVVFNTAAEQMFRCSAAEALGQPIDRFIPERFHKAHAGHIRIFGQRGITRRSMTSLEPLAGLRADGEEFPIEATISQVQVNGEKLFTVIIRDITERMRAEMQLRQMQQQAEHRVVVMETARQVALDILSSRTGREALHHIADVARTLAHARYAALGVANPSGHGLREFVTVGLIPEEEEVIGPLPGGVGLLGLLLTRTEPLRIDRLSEHSASVGFPPNHPPMTSFLGVPIRHGDRTLGSLYLTDREGDGGFTDADEVAVQALGDYAAVAIHNWYLLSRQRALVQGLIAAQEEERRAVAYDLHDGLTQYVMASHAHLETAWRVQEAGDRDKSIREMTRGMGYLQHAVVESRRLVNGLRTLTLDELGLAGALEQLLQEEKACAGWTETQFVHNVDGVRYDITLETTAYRVAQEAINNARKHAHTSRLQLTLLSEVSETGQERLCLEVQDWGVGFVPEEKLLETKQVGLHSMAERVGLLGGIYTLQSAPGEGTHIRVVFSTLQPQDDEFRGKGK